MKIAGLNVRITFQKNEVHTDKYGYHTNTWTDYYTCWATAISMTNNEAQEAGQTIENDITTFTVRYSSETAPITSTGYRIILEDRIYDIDAVDDMGFHKKSRKFRCSLTRR